MRPEGVDWKTLLEEFKEFEPDREALEIECEPFMRTLVSPVPRFVRILLRSRFKSRVPSPEQIKVLFYFLLHKRYTNRLNLLHFAFNLFDDDCYLPAELISQVPFPHEEGIPRYVLRLDPDYEY